MRIIAGLYRGRKIKTLPGQELRPTPERLRETLFDVLGPSVEGSSFVDAYAGTGAVGIEALSRGARWVSFIEESSAAIRILKENLHSLGIHGSVDVVHAPVRRGLQLLEARGIRAGFCFLDPPYAAHGEYEASLRWLSRGELMLAEGLIVMQHGKKEELQDASGRLTRVRLLTQGSNALSFYRIAAEDPLQ